MLRRWLIGALLLSPLSGASCAAVLDIEEAELDETIGAGGSQTQGTPCEEYCDTVMANCTQGDGFDRRQYDSRDTCLGVCARFPSGTEGDTSGPTVACRQHYAELAATSEPDVHCPIAGPGGNGQCGANCLNFCTIVVPSCPGAYNNPIECATDCGRLPDLEDYNVTMDAGGHVQCRLYHASVATLAPDVHCRHAKGASPCVP